MKTTDELLQIGEEWLIRTSDININWEKGFNRYRELLRIKSIEYLNKTKSLTQKE